MIMVKDNLSEGLPRYRENGKDYKDIGTRVFHNIDEGAVFGESYGRKLEKAMRMLNGTKR